MKNYPKKNYPKEAQEYFKSVGGLERKPSSQRGYDSRWRKVRAAKLYCNPFCEECEKGEILVKATMVHHIQPIEQGGEPLMWENLQSLCESCHDKKHSRNTLGNVGGCNADGMPINKRHPWNET